MSSCSSSDIYDFKFTWKIRNLYVFHWCYLNRIMSPVFKVNFNGFNTEWCLAINGFEATLQRLDNDTEYDSISVGLKFLCVKADGHVDSMYAKIHENFLQRRVYKVVSQDQWMLMCTRKALYLPDGHLTLCCHLKNYSFQEEFQIQITAETEIELNKILYQKRLSDILNLQLGENVICSPSIGEDFKFLLMRNFNHLSLNIICNSESRKSNRCFCKLKLVNCQEGYLEFTEEKRFSILHRELYIRVDICPIFKLVELMTKSVPQDILYLQFEFIYDSGDVHSRIITMNNLLPREILHQNVVHLNDNDLLNVDKLRSFSIKGNWSEMSENFAMKLWSAAEKNQITLLKEQCISYLKSNISLQNAKEIFKFSVIHQEEILGRIAEECLCSQFRGSCPL